MINGNKVIMEQKINKDKIKESLLASMKSEKNTEDAPLKKEIEFLLKRL